MISQINASNAYNSFMNSVDGAKKDIGAKGAKFTSQNLDVDKVKQLKESIENGTYKIDIDALSKKIAEELLQ
jgi:anti-sigma28 factor (negative regulator of flagellin synthesis)